MSHRHYFAVKPRLAAPAPATLFVQEAHNEVFIGPYGRLSGLNGMAHLDSETLARRFAEACAPLLQKRHGAATTVEVVLCSANDTNRLAARIEKDSAIVAKRLAGQNYAAHEP